MTLSKLLDALMRYSQEMDKSESSSIPRFWAKDFFYDREDEILSGKLNSTGVKNEVPKYLTAKKPSANVTEAILHFEELLVYYLEMKSSGKTKDAKRELSIAGSHAGLEYRGNNDTRSENLASAYELATYGRKN
jgi:hypothetical protein